jgi:hypothetical protein
LAEKGRIENYKKAAEFSFLFRNLIDSYSHSYSPHTMSTSTNANTISKVYTFASNDPNSAVKSVTWNILDERPHKAYLNRTHKVAVVRRHLLQILAISAGIRQQAIALTNIATNTYVAAVSLNNPMKTFNVLAFDHVNELIKELSISANFNAEKHAHAIAEKVIDMLNDLPDEGNQLEIKAAKRMVRAYQYPVPTRPSTPENVEMEPIPIPAPKATTSAWQRTFQQLANQANKENISPTKASPTNYPTNWNSPTIMHEVHHLCNYLKSVPPPQFPTIFKLTDDFLFLDHNESNSSRLSYWNLILSKYYDEDKKIDRYANKVFKYIEAGVDNAKIFIGFNDKTSVWYFAKDKRSLFNVIEGATF